MKSIISPKLFAIDTSILAKVAKDYNSRNQVERKKASKFLSTITDRGLIPFFCWHHLVEIFQHDNDLVVYGRISLIKKFPQVAWVKPLSPEGLVGSIIDIQGTEIIKLLNDSNISLEKLISEIKQDLIVYSSGESFVNIFEDKLLLLRKHNLFETQKSKEVSSISHVSDPKIDSRKLSELHHSRLKNLNEVKESMESIAVNLKENLSTRGDRALTNQDKVVGQFVAQVLNDGCRMYESNSEPLYENFINSCGVEEHEIDENWNVEELGQYAIFKNKIKVIARSFCFDIEKALKIPQDSIPSWFIWTELDKKIKEEKYASGSNIIDKYLASLSLYADILIVDKRVKEYFNQIARKNITYSCVNNNVIKLSNYEYLEKQLDKIK